MLSGLLQQAGQAMSLSYLIDLLPFSYLNSPKIICICINISVNRLISQCQRLLLRSIIAFVLGRCLRNRGVAAASIDARDNSRHWQPHSARRPDSPQAQTKTRTAHLMKRFPNPSSEKLTTIFGRPNLRRLPPRPRAYRRKTWHNFMRK